MRAGFWRRLAAAWVDAFVIYALATFLITLVGVTRLRISFEPLCIAVGVVYCAALVRYRGQTIGKALLGVAVTTQEGERPGWRHVLLREGLGKWGIGLLVPAVLGRVIAGQAWVPTIYDLLILLPWLLLLWVGYLIVKRTWYDLLAGTVAQRVQPSAGPALVALAGVAMLGLGAKGTEYAVRGWLPCRLAVYHSMRSTAPYVAFLEQRRTAPVDYVLGLFDRYDVVVLCERPHPEASQWDFILDVLGDPRFQDRVGHVFTEYGSAGMQGYLDEFLATDGLSPAEVHQRVVHLMRNFSVWPVWTNTNVYSYLTRLYELNQSLPREKRIHPHFTDAPTDWAAITESTIEAHWRSLENRDEQMARRVIDEMDRLAKSGDKRSKCLVVMNYRHAFDLMGRSPESQRYNTYEFLQQAFGPRAANVLLNTDILLCAPIAGGVWDAAFAEAGQPQAGFDFAGSPFGEDAFDLFPFIPTARSKLKYRDVFTGFVYVHPLESQYLQHSVPGYYEGFEEEALRRAALVSEDYRRGIEQEIAQEKAGKVAEKEELPRKRIETLAELGLLALAGIGLLIGVPVGITRSVRARKHATGVR